jgi:hypothetical protein
VHIIRLRIFYHTSPDNPPGAAQAGEIERALAISKMQGAAGGTAQRASMLNWLRGGVRNKAAGTGPQSLAAPPTGPNAITPK